MRESLPRIVYTVGYLPAEIDEAFDAALAIERPGMKSYLVQDAVGGLPKIPMVSQRKYQAQMRDLLYHYMVSPSFGSRHLTDEEIEQLTPFEVGLWNLCKKFQDEDTDFTERKWIAEMLMGPVVQRNENVNLNVNQDWRDEMRTKGEEVADVMAQARAKEEATDAEIVDDK